MATFNIMDAINELQKERNLPKEDLIGALESALASAYRKNFGPNTNVEVKITDRVTVYAIKDIVEAVEDDQNEMTLVEAKKIDEAAEVGDQVTIEVTPKEFGRIAAQTAKQVIIQKIREAERRLTFEEFQERVGQVVIAKVQRYERGDVYLSYQGAEMIMPSREQIPGERYRPGDRVKGIIEEVAKTTKGPQIVLSRGSTRFLERLFEQEIPEIEEGYVRIESVAREPGVRSKVAVSSVDEHVDPVGACVGLKGSRIQVIVNEVQGEKIDIVHYSDNLFDFVSAALSPARPLRIDYDEVDERVAVVVPQHQLSLAIGKEGQNVRLAARLTGLKIDIISADEIGDIETAELFPDRAAKAAAGQQPAAPEGPAPEGQVPEAASELPPADAGASTEDDEIPNENDMN